MRNTKYTIKLLRFLSQGSCTVELLICVLAAVIVAAVRIYRTAQPDPLAVRVPHCFA